MGASITSHRAALRFALVAFGALLSACQPNFGTPASLVDSLRVLALSADPAEAAPGSMVSYTALLADQTGERPDLAKGMNWAFCNQEKPLSDLGDVSSGCFTYSGDYLVPLGNGATVSGTLPQSGCSLFGPSVPAAMMGMAAGRPADPDPSGGYYQPVRLILQSGGDTVLAAEESRIVCQLPPAASNATLVQFKMEYKANTNPVIAGLEDHGAGAAIPTDDGSHAYAVKAGEKLDLSVSWPACPADASQPCGAEPYAYYDPETNMVTMRRETLTVSFFATGGAYDVDDKTVAADDTSTSTDNGWTAPTKAGTVMMWMVLRDDRGGASWQRYRLQVM